MRNTDLLGLSIHNLLLHKIRSFLTSLGIIFGVGSVIAMLAISEGARKQALKQIEAMGIDNVIVYTKKPSLEGKKSTDSSSQSMVQVYGLTQQNLGHIKEMDNVKTIATLRNARKVALKGVTRLDVKLVSVTDNFPEIAGARRVAGRWFSKIDSQNKSMVCVIGRNIRRKMFNLGESKIIGSRIRIEEALFTVVGIIEDNGASNIPEVGGINDMIFIPQATSETLYGSVAIERTGGRRSTTITQIDYDIFFVKVKNNAVIDNTARRIRAYLHKNHSKIKDWEVLVPLELFKQKEQTQQIFTIVMASIAGISLIVGGVGIMNIMLANIYERRKEIGTRRALGAKQGDILRQFLVETVFLTSIGGVVGVVLGVGISQAVTHYAKWPTVYSVWSMVFSLVISSAVGIIFGTYPAIKAAKQSPIDVLRSE